jgi:hypothetical protein
VLGLLPSQEGSWFLVVSLISSLSSSFLSPLSACILGLD